MPDTVLWAIQQRGKGKTGSRSQDHRQGGDLLATARAGASFWETERRTKMSGLNKAQPIGNLGRDPELRATQNGSSIATPSVAASESWKDRNTGERKEKTEWHRAVILNTDGLCRPVERCLARGSKVYVEGQIRTRKWTDTDGIERCGTEIHVTPCNGAITFLDGKRDNDERAPRREPANARPGDSTGIDLDDDVLFQRLPAALPAPFPSPGHAQGRLARRPCLTAPALEHVMHDRTPEPPFPDACRKRAALRPEGRNAERLPCAGRRHLVHKIETDL